jgi:hypothetical protein
VSVRAQRSAKRLDSIRDRALNSIAAWDDSVPTERNSVFVPVVDDAETVLEHMEDCIQQDRLEKVDHLFVDGGVLVRFRRKRDADRFRQAFVT